uniref:CRISPR system precrRNA processing endoribonuclease RAMP protein Cas6 n=1 Tax=Gracilinema caldarium TaxID=215591 RepID=A0A7C3E7A5_9SPIR
MTIDVKTLYFKIHFEKPTLIDTYPTFALRSVLGYQLRRMHCISHTSQCVDCVFRQTCANALLFETIIEKDTPILPGRDRASHPFRLFCHAEPGTVQQDLTVMVQLYGKGCDYVPHMIFAIREAGKNGLFRSRTPFTLSVYNTQHQPVLEDDTVRIKDIPTETYTFPDSFESISKTLHITCLSPLRFKVEGRYRSDFSASDFVMASLRRHVTLFTLYGTDFANNNAEGPPDMESLSDLQITSSQRKWKDYMRYSSRQKTLMKMGGVIGDFIVSGTAPAWAWDSITLAGSLGSGKNTSFGFGNIRVREVEDGILH